jgi:small-conductance mechanosensitive channel
MGWMSETLGIGLDSQQKVLLTLLAVLLAWLVRRLVLRAIYQRVDDVKARYQWQKNTGYAAALLAMLVVARVWFEGFQSIATYLGLLSAGLAIALKDLVADLAGWIFLLWRKPFEVGDRIQIGDHSGDVIDIRIFQFTLLEIGNWVGADQSTGRVIHIPNWKIFSEAQANYSKGFQYIWEEIPVLLTFESDWPRAKAILDEIVKRHSEHLTEEAAQKVKEASRQFMIFYSALTPKVYTNVQDSGVLLTMRFLCNPRRRRAVQEAIWEDVLRAFAAEPHIDFAYPTQRFYDNRAEGKKPIAPPDTDH